MYNILINITIIYVIFSPNLLYKKLNKITVVKKQGKNRPHLFRQRTDLQLDHAVIYMGCIARHIQRVPLTLPFDD